MFIHFVALNRVSEVVIDMCYGDIREMHREIIQSDAQICNDSVQSLQIS